MNLCKIVFLTVILIVKVSCQQIIDSLAPTNLLPPSLFSHYKQQQQLQFNHHKPDIDDDDGDNDNTPFVMTASKKTPRADSASNLSLLDKLQKQIIANDNIESADEQLTNIKNNKTKNFIQNFILYEWLTSQHDHDLIKPTNNNDKIENSWRYYDDSEYDDSISSNNYEAMNQDKRSALRSARMSRRSQKKKETDDSFLPSVSVGEFPGAMSKLNDFFDQLNTNIKTLETTPNYHHISFDDIAYLESQAANNKKEYANDYYVKPSGTAAFLHAIRTYRPSQKIRGLVALQPESYRGANFHDPNFLWQGLGK